MAHMVIGLILFGFVLIQVSAALARPSHKSNLRYSRHSTIPNLASLITLWPDCQAAIPRDVPPPGCHAMAFIVMVCVTLSVSSQDLRLTTSCEAAMIELYCISAIGTALAMLSMWRSKAYQSAQAKSCTEPHDIYGRA